MTREIRRLVGSGPIIQITTTFRARIQGSADPRDVPSPTNALGVKGAGEGGTVGAPAALIHAILDALSPLGVTHIDMPATPEGVWRAIQDARSRPADASPRDPE